MNTSIATLSKLLDSIRERQKSKQKQEIVVHEWGAKLVATTIAGTVDDKGKYQKAVGKQQFPWEQFGFPEMVSDVDDDDDDSTDYLTPKPPPPHREEGEDPEFDYILGEGNMKAALRDNAKIGNIELAVSQIAR